MLWTTKILFFVLSFVLVLSGGNAQEAEFVSLIQNLLQGDELKMFQKTYSALPLEVRDKITKNLLTNPGQLGQDLLGFLGPQVQNIITGLAGGGKKTIPVDSDNEVNVDTMDMEYSKDGTNQKRRQQQQSTGGMDFGPIAGMLGNLVSSNPQMLLTMAQGLLQGNSQGFSFESITSLLTQQFDIDTVISLAQSFGGLPSSSGGGGSDRLRGEGDVAKPKGIADILQINELVKQWTAFSKSPLGIKVNRVLPRLIKSETLPDALRLLEKETSFRFDVILRQLQDPTFRRILVSQAVKPIGQFFKSITIPKDLKEVLTKADDILNNKLGLGVKAKEFIEPVFTYIRDTFSITHESLLDLKSEDIERIATDILNKEMLEPLGAVWDAHEKARKNSQCAQFIYCQLNHNYYNENFIRRNVIKTSSIVSAFQVSSTMKRDAFSLLYEGAYKGADGLDCTHGVNSRCLELMHTAAHNEL